MERLTERTKIPTERFGVCVRVKNNQYVEAIERLAEYEDTGHTPGEIKPIIKALMNENKRLYEGKESLKVDNERLREDEIRDAICRTMQIEAMETIVNESEQLKTENKRLKDNCESMRQLMAEYCAKVEDGKIRGNTFYYEFMQMLRTIDIRDV